MTISKSLSKRIEILRFPLIAGIVLIHMHTSDITFSGGFNNPYNVLVTLFSEIVARVSVPLFFILSGFLFFATLRPGLEGFLQKFRSRVSTLLIPFLFWNALIFLFFAIAQNLPATAHYFTGERPLVMQLDFLQQLTVFFGVGEFQYPVAYQFWFIRDLMIMVLLSPLIYLLLRVAALPLLAALFLLWFFDVRWHTFIQMDPASLFFFTLGAWFGMRGFSPEWIDRRFRMLLLFYGALIIIYLATENFYLYQGVILAGVAVVFGMTRYLVQMQRIRLALEHLAKYSFFLFALHEPVLSIVRKVMLKVAASQSDLAIFLLYLFSAAVTILLVLFCYRLCERVAPGILRIATGSRV